MNTSPRPSPSTMKPIPCPVPPPKKKNKEVPIFRETYLPDFLITQTETALNIHQKLGNAAFTYHPYRLQSNETLKAQRNALWPALKYLDIISIDPGTRHFAVRAERRSLSEPKTETLFMDVFDLEEGLPDEARMSENAKKEKKSGKTNDRGELYTHAKLRACFCTEPLYTAIRNAHILLMERQEFDNNLATRISMFAFGLVFEMMVAANPEARCPWIVETCTKLKNHAIEVPPDICAKYDVVSDEKVYAPDVRGLTRHFLKKSGLHTAHHVLERHGDEGGRALLLKHKSKKDDMADTICQIEALWRYIGYPS